MMRKISWSQAVQDLRSGDGNRAVKAWDVISELADESHVPDLYALIQDDDWLVREVAAGPLAQLEGVKSLPFLFQALTRGEQDGHDNDGLAFTVAELLELEKKKAAVFLLLMLESKDVKLREHAVWALGFVASEISPEPLLDCFKSDPNPRIRSEAAGALGSFKSNPEVVTVLLAGIHDGDENVRISVVSSLGYLGDRRAIPPLQELLKTAQGKIRTFTEDALRQLGGLSVWQRFIHWATELVK